jgi:hypothetical protein
VKEASQTRGELILSEGVVKASPRVSKQTCDVQQNYSVFLHVEMKSVSTRRYTFPVQNSPAIDLAKCFREMRILTC